MDRYEMLAKQIDWKSLLIANYKSLDLSEEEVMVILVSQYCLDQQESMITPDLLALKMNYDVKKISEILTSLLNKNLLSLEIKDGKHITTLFGIKRLIIDEFIDNEDHKEFEKDASNLYGIFEKEFSRPLTFAEVEKLKEWINYGYKEEEIIYGLRQASLNNVKNMRYIDKILLENRQQQERKQEGYTTFSNSWNKDLEESIKIANIKWVDKNENKK